MLNVYQMAMLDFLTSQIFLTIVACWGVAKVIKGSIRLSRGWKFGDISQPGGFPSEHTAFVVGMFFATAFETSWDPVLTSITAVVAIVVMYDATHVRYQTELHAKILNKIGNLEEKLKETHGHTYFEVFSGVVIALLVSLVSYYL
ncbi:hypothetical protein GF389_04935 [Candidatus Dojkabacteria bacterium]|nr:hypothetical protein [Candidatus Dojkabacteria bacterium]